MSAANLPWSVTTPVTRPPEDSMPVTVWWGRNRAPRAVARRACASAARTALAMPSPGVWKPASTRSRSSSGCSAVHSPGSSRRLSTPHAVA